MSTSTITYDHTIERLESAIRELDEGLTALDSLRQLVARMEEDDEAEHLETIDGTIDRLEKRLNFLALALYQLDDLGRSRTPNSLLALIHAGLGALRVPK